MALIPVGEMAIIVEPKGRSHDISCPPGSLVKVLRNNIGGYAGAPFQYWIEWEGYTQYVPENALVPLEEDTRDISEWL